MDLTAIVDDYVAAWNERDAERRAALLAGCFSPTGTYQDPLYSVAERDVDRAHRWLPAALHGFHDDAAEPG